MVHSNMSTVIIIAKVTYVPQCMRIKQETSLFSFISTMQKCMAILLQNNKKKKLHREWDDLSHDNNNTSLMPINCCKANAIDNLDSVNNCTILCGFTLIPRIQLCKIISREFCFLSHLISFNFVCRMVIFFVAPTSSFCQSNNFGFYWIFNLAYGYLQQLFLSWLQTFEILSCAWMLHWTSINCFRGFFRLSFSICLALWCYEI